MKMILQKHTSKFVAGLFNSLGITACVALTACGGENKVKQTENQVENLKSVLLSKGLNDKDAQAIADWLNNKNYGSDYKLNAKDLQEIFQNDSKLNEVAEKLGVKLTEPDEEKNKEINEWLSKLNSLNDTDFKNLGSDLKEKVAQKFIANKVNINEVTVIKEKLAGFIEEVKDESKIIVKIEGQGKVTITNVADKKTTGFVFDKIDVLKAFVGYLKDKEITTVEGKLSFAFNGKNVKICNHESGFGFSDKLVDFFNCFGILARIENLNLDVSGLSLKVEGDGLKLNGEVCSDVYFKDAKFWTLVKDYAAFFSITRQSFEIEKNGEGESATVKINGFESSLKWNEVVGEEDTLKEGFEWGKIFKLKGEEESKDVTVKFEKGKYYIDTDKEGVELNSLGALKGLVEALDDKNVKIGGKKNFSLAFDDKNVKVCGHTEGFEVMKKTDFETLLGYVKSLKDVKAVEDKFTIKIAVATNDIELGGKKIDQTFMKTENFWKAVKAHNKLFKDLPIKVVKNDTENSNKGKIGTTVIDVDVFNGDKIATDWESIFTKVDDE